MRLDSSRIGSQLVRLWWGGQQQQFSRVGGWQALACLNPAMHKASDAGHIGPHGMRRCLSFSYRGSVLCRRPPPEAQKRLFFEECSMCIKHRKYRQKWPLGGVGLGQGAGAQKTRTPGGNWFSCCCFGGCVGSIIEDELGWLLPKMADGWPKSTKWHPILNFSTSNKHNLIPN